MSDFFKSTRDGRKRDTYENLRKDGNAFIHFLPPTMDMARLADDSGQQLEVGISELDELNLQASPLNELLMSNSLYAIETTFKTEYEMPHSEASFAYWKSKQFGNTQIWMLLNLLKCCVSMEWTD